MRSYPRDDWRDSRPDGTLIGTVLALMVAAGIALMAMIVLQPRASGLNYVAPPGVGSAIAAEAGPTEPDRTETSSVRRSEAPACNVSQCEQAYRSFRASDCTFQPYDGARKLCRR